MKTQIKRRMLFLLLIAGTMSMIMPQIEAHQLKPDVIYDYIPISGTVEYGTADQYGPYGPYAISLYISATNPSGYSFWCEIQVGRVNKWAGYLGAGQSSGTITVNGANTYVRIWNFNAITVSYTGIITLINN